MFKKSSFYSTEVINSIQKFCDKAFFEGRLLLIGRLLLLYLDSNNKFELYVSYFQENFVEKNTQFMSTKMFDMIKKSLGEFIDNDMLNQTNASKSVTNCLRNELGKLMKKLNENVITTICYKINYRPIIHNSIRFLGFSFHSLYQAK